MILTDREIAIALQGGLVNIEPAPSPDAYSSTSIDLKLGRIFASWVPKNGMQIRPGAPGFAYSDYIEMQKKEELASFELKPHSFVLAWTEERVTIPIKSRLAARVEGKSSMARLGISVHVTAPTIHSGFEGFIQLEMFNFGPHCIILDAGMRICQLIFEQTSGTPEKGYQGMFAGQAPGQ